MNPIPISKFLSVSYSFRIDTVIYRSSLETIPDYKPNGESVYLFADQNRAKTLPDEAEHTYIIYISEFPPGIPLNGGFFTRAIDRNVLFRN